MNVESKEGVPYWPDFLASSSVPSLCSHISAGSLIWSTRGFSHAPQFRLRIAGMVLAKMSISAVFFPFREEELFILLGFMRPAPMTKVPKAFDAPLSPYLTART